MFMLVLLAFARIANATAGGAVRSVGLADDPSTSTMIMLVIMEALVIVAVLQFVLALARRRGMRARKGTSVTRSRGPGG